MTRPLRWRPPMHQGPARLVELDPRHADVLTGLCLGYTNRQIGNCLGIEEETVKSRVRVVLRALKARDRCHAVALACSTVVTVDVAPKPRRNAA